jgi:hypothetical protein
MATRQCRRYLMYIYIIYELLKNVLSQIKEERVNETSRIYWADDIAVPVRIYSPLFLLASISSYVT